MLFVQEDLKVMPSVNGRTIFPNVVLLFTTLCCKLIHMKATFGTFFWVIHFVLVLCAQCLIYMYQYLLRNFYLISFTLIDVQTALIAQAVVIHYLREPQLLLFKLTKLMTQRQRKLRKYITWHVAFVGGLPVMLALKIKVWVSHWYWVTLVFVH